MSKYRLRTKRAIKLFLIISIIGYYFLLLYNSQLYRDTFFHIGRIYEIRYAFQHLEFPNWLNFQSFFGIGQAVNGMYPDISLYPFVLLTMPLSPFHQVIAIQVLITFLTIITTYICLTHRHIPTDISLYTSIIYTFLLQCRKIEFQPGTSIILIFGLPIAFTTFDILASKKLNIKLAIKFALVIILILYSHFLSIIVLAFIMVGVFVYLLITKKTSFYAIANIFIASLTSIPALLPVIYRYLLINSSKLTMPALQGNIGGETFPSLIKSSSLIIFTVMIVLLTYRRHSLKEAFFSPLTLLTLYVCFLCTSYFPWKLFNQIPLINSLQSASFRFLPVLYIIAAIFLSQTQEKNIKQAYKVLSALSVFIISLSAVLFMYRVSEIKLPLNTDTYKRVVRISGNYNKEDRHINQDMYYDYYPAGVPSSFKDGFFLSRKGQEYVWNPRIKAEKGQIPIKKNAINNGIEIIPLKSLTSRRGRLELPILGYKNLHYQVKINDKNVPYTIANLYISIQRHHIKRLDTITVMYHNPTIYTWLMLVALIYALLLILASSYLI